MISGPMSGVTSIACVVMAPEAEVPPAIGVLDDELLNAGSDIERSRLNTRSGLVFEATTRRGAGGGTDVISVRRPSSRRTFRLAMPFAPNSTRCNSWVWFGVPWCRVMRTVALPPIGLPQIVR